MLSSFFNIFDYIYNNIFFCYYIYITLYKLNLFIKCYISFFFNVLKYYIISNKIAINTFKPFLFIYNFIKNSLLWFNRRYLKKRKRFRVYYKYHNVRYWKFFLFFFYINIFFFIWKKRNLYRKSQIIFILIFLHITVLILLHFFIGLFNSFDIGFLSCIFFLFIIFMIFKR